MFRFGVQVRFRRVLFRLGFGVLGSSSFALSVSGEAADPSGGDPGSRPILGSQSKRSHVIVSCTSSKSFLKYINY